MTRFKSHLIFTRFRVIKIQSALVMKAAKQAIEDSR